MSNAYVTVESLKGSAVLPASGSNIDARLRDLSEGISREVDKFLKRPMYARTGTFFFSGNGKRQLLTPDIISVTSIKEDNNNDGTFNITWDANDFHLAPFNVDPTSTYDAQPYRKIEVNRNSKGTQDVFQRGQRNYEIIGTFGYSASVQDVGASASADFNASTTTFDVDAQTVEVGMTIQIGSEQMYVLDKPSTGTSISVERGVNNTVAASFGSGAGINVYIYPEPITEAVIGQVSRIFARQQAKWANELGLPETGQIQVFRGDNKLDPDIRALIAGYKKLY